MYPIRVATLATATFLAMLTAGAQAAQTESAQTPTGKELAFDNRKGNCLACHRMPSDPSAVTNTDIAPPLVSMKARFPDRAKLYAQVWDATRANGNTLMPPFGKHKILTEDEINKIVDYIYEL